MEKEEAQKALRELISKARRLCDGFIQLAESLERLNDASSDLFQTIEEIVEAHPELVEAEECGPGEIPGLEPGTEIEFGDAQGPVIGEKKGIYFEDPPAGA